MIDQVTMWQRSHDNKWSVCLLVKSLEHDDYLYKQRFVFSDFDKACRFVGALSQIKEVHNEKVSSSLNTLART